LNCNFCYKYFIFQNSRKTAWGRRRQWKGGRLAAGSHPMGICPSWRVSREEQGMGHGTMLRRG